MRWSNGGKMRNLPSIVALQAKIRWINELLVLRHIFSQLSSKKNVQSKHREFHYLQTHVGGKL